jgi:hypothetical protein
MGRRNTLPETHVLEYIRENQRDRQNVVEVKNADLWTS